MRILFLALTFVTFPQVLHTSVLEGHRSEYFNARDMFPQMIYWDTTLKPRKFLLVTMSLLNGMMI